MAASTLHMPSHSTHKDRAANHARLLKQSELDPFAPVVAALAQTIWTCETIATHAPMSPSFVSFCSDIIKVTHLSMPVILYGLYFLFRLRYSQQFPVHENLRYMFVLALVLAHKFHEDSTYSNKSWAEASSLDLHYLNYLEKAALRALDYNLSVKEQTFQSWLLLIDYNPHYSQLSCYDEADFLWAASSPSSTLHAEEYLSPWSPISGGAFTHNYVCGTHGYPTAHLPYCQYTQCNI
jgi:hypothetical protein